MKRWKHPEAERQLRKVEEKKTATSERGERTGVEVQADRSAGGQVTQERRRERDGGGGDALLRRRCWGSGRAHIQFCTAKGFSPWTHPAV